MSLNKGRGIAVELGEAGKPINSYCSLKLIEIVLIKLKGATVYITGRTLNSKNGMGSIEDTANEVKLNN